METILALFTSPSSAEVSNISIILLVRERADVIATAAEATITTDTHPTTELIEFLQAVLNGNNAALPAVLVALQIQSKFLNELCFYSFFLISKRLASLLNRELATIMRKEIADISYRITKLSCKFNRAKGVLNFMRTLLALTSFSDKCLTCIQVDFLQMYGLALDYLNTRHFFEIDLSQSTLTAEECCRFFYYKGICHVADKDYGRALKSFLTVMSLPANGLSLIAVKSLKKSRLISLIYEQKALVLPIYAHPSLISFLREKCRDYDELVEKFTSNDLFGLEEIVRNRKETFITDQNLGLAKQVVLQLRDVQVQRVAEAFTTITVTELARRLVCVEEQAISYLLDMMSRRKINVEISDGMVKFLPLTSEVTLHNAHALLNNAFCQLTELTNMLKDKHAALLCSPAYVSQHLRGGSYSMSSKHFKAQAGTDF